MVGCLNTYYVIAGVAKIFIGTIYGHLVPLGAARLGLPPPKHTHPALPSCVYSNPPICARSVFKLHSHTIRARQKLYMNILYRLNPGVFSSNQRSRELHGSSWYTYLHDTHTHTVTPLGSCSPPHQFPPPTNHPTSLSWCVGTLFVLGLTHFDPEMRSPPPFEHHWDYRAHKYHSHPSVLLGAPGTRFLPNQPLHSLWLVDGNPSCAWFDPF